MIKISQNEGTLVIAPIRPWDSLDVYPSVYCNEALGGLHSVADTSSRNLITAERRQEGMLCYTTDSQKLYQLVGGTSNANWAELIIGTGSSDQNLWETFTSDSGSATASSTTDTFSFSGTDGITTKITGDNLIIGYTGSTGSATDELVKASATDTSSNYLLSKLTAGSNITLTLQNTGSDEYIEIASTASGTGATTFLDLTDTPADYLTHLGKVVSVNNSEDGLEFTPKVDDKFRIDSNDTASGYFTTKITAGAGLSFTIGNVGGDEFLTIDADVEEDKYVKISSTDTQSNYLNSKLTSSGSIIQTILNSGSNEILSLDFDTAYLNDYFYLPGRTGGQTGYGGISSSDSLYLYNYNDTGSGLFGSGILLYGDANPVAGVQIFAGHNSAGAGQYASIVGGNAITGDEKGGLVNIQGGAGHGTGSNGTVTINAWNGEIQCAGDLIPNTSAANNIGSMLKRWENGYFINTLSSDYRLRIGDTGSSGSANFFQGSGIQPKDINYILPASGNADSGTYILSSTFVDVVGGGTNGYLDWMNQNILLPCGSILSYGGSTSPTGFLMCTGGSYATSSYSELYSVIGYSFGGSGSNFNVPNMVSRFPYGGTGSTIGTIGGASSFSLQDHTIQYNHNVGLVRVPQDPQDQDVVQSIADHSDTLPHDSIPTIPPYVILNYIIKY